MGRLEDKVAIITGAGRGIGQSTALLFSKEGAKVVVFDIDEQTGKCTTSKIQEQGGSATFVHGDVSNAKDAQRLVNTTVDIYGSLSILVNNAAIFPVSKCADLSIEDWNQGLAINTTGVFLTCKYAIPVMLNAGGGSIVNVSSISGMAADYGLTAYNTSKAAVLNLTRSIAIDYIRQGIRCNAIVPGLVLTQFIEPILKSDSRIIEFCKRNYPRGRAGLPGEIANCILFLASDESSFVNGHALVADGGMMAHTGQPNIVNINDYIQWGRGAFV